MKIFAFLISLGLSKPKGRQRKFCTASCAGETSDWTSYLSNGVQATGKTTIMSRVTMLVTDDDFVTNIIVDIDTLKTFSFKLT